MDIKIPEPNIIVRSSWASPDSSGNFARIGEVVVQWKVGETLTERVVWNGPVREAAYDDYSATADDIAITDAGEALAATLIKLMAS